MKKRTGLRCWLLHRRWWSVVLHVLDAKFVRVVRCLWCSAQWSVAVGQVPESALEQLKRLFPNRPQPGGDA